MNIRINLYSISSIFRYYNQIGNGYLKEIYELTKIKEF